MNRTLVSLALVPLFLLAGCGSATQTAPPSTGAPAATAPVVTPTATPSAAPAELQPPMSTKEIKVDRAAGTPPTVTGARFAQHQGFDRVVIDLKETCPATRCGGCPSSSRTAPATGSTSRAVPTSS